MGRQTRIVVAEDHDLVRQGFRALIEALPDMRVVAEAADGRIAVEQVREHAPDVLLLDLGLPSLNGIEVARIVSAETATRILVLSVYSDEQHVREALRAGASGYLLKDSSVGELERAIAAVVSGNSYLSPAIAKHVIDGLLNPRSDDDDVRSVLTPRQREVLQLIAEGHSTKRIAYLLDLSVKTVETHRAEIMRRLDTHDVAGLTRYAIRAGLTTLED